MKLDLRPLLAGERLLEFEYELTCDIDPEDTASFLYGVSFPSPMKVKGDITNTAGYMRMILSVSLDYIAECARCLSKVSGSFSFDLEKTVAPREILSGLDEDRLDDYAIIDDGFLDLDAGIREQLEVEFPIRFLCKEDCKGLCSKCGKNLNDGDCDCAKGEIDPRFAPLQQLLEKMKNNK
ncbi:MAG: DUF177 domain-containing protein [Clostridia bacterium]|nr:DUF177 domain-containing protein [Clostridia bacterium]